MNDEIKEILEEIDNKIIPNEHWNKIKDYITNLQEEIERLNNIIDELENMLENEIDYMEHMNCEVRDDNMYKMINLIKELKEDKDLLNIINGGDDK